MNIGIINFKIIIFMISIFVSYDTFYSRKNALIIILKIFGSKLVLIFTLVKSRNVSMFFKIIRENKIVRIIRILILL